jgi:hypothetical protein
MLSTQYRLRLEGICNKIAKHEEVSLEDMIWWRNLESKIALREHCFVRLEEHPKIPTCKKEIWMIF